MEDTAQLLMESFARRDQAVGRGDWAQAELICEEEVRLGRHLFSLVPNAQFGSSLGVSLVWFGQSLISIGAHPEAEAPLQEARDLLRKYGRFDEDCSDPNLIDALLFLGRVYEGVQFYWDGRAPVLTIPAMKDLRRIQKPALLVGMVSDRWRGKAEEPLREAVALARGLARPGGEKWNSSLARSLFCLGVSLIPLGRAVEAAEALREAEGLYRQLLRYDLDFYAARVKNTQEKLLELATSHASQPTDRRSALEALLPKLRAEAHPLTQDEVENGVTLAKARARKRLLDALQELKDLYEAEGQKEKVAQLWAGDYGVLYSESLKIRLD